MSRNSDMVNWRGFRCDVKNKYKVFLVFLKSFVFLEKINYGTNL